jgi:hypothetical protein
MTDPNERPFSPTWTFVSVVLFLAVELFIGTWLGPLVLGKYVSPMFHIQVQMLMHLGSLYLGGLIVGVISPGRRLMEPAIGAFLSVLLVFSMSLFMPGWFLMFSWLKVLVGGGIGFLLALAGAWTGEKWMGNLPPDQLAHTARGRLRSSMWEDELAQLTPRDRERER